MDPGARIQKLQTNPCDLDLLTRKRVQLPQRQFIIKQLNPRGGYSSSSRAGRLGRTLWPQNSTAVSGTEKGGQNSTMTPPTLEKGGQYSTSVWKVCKKRGQKSTILKNIGVKILQVWKWGSKFYMLKNRDQNSTVLEKRGVNILHPTPKVEVKILHRLKKGGQKGRAYPLPKIRAQNIVSNPPGLNL